MGEFGKIHLVKVVVVEIEIQDFKVSSENGSLIILSGLSEFDSKTSNIL